MNKFFLKVLHEEEIISDLSLDKLKGGQTNGHDIGCYCNGEYCDDYTIIS